MTLVDTPVPALRFSVIHAATSFSSSGNAADQPRRARLFRGVFSSFSRCERQRRTQLSFILNCFPAARFPFSTAYATTRSLKDAVYDALGEPLPDMMTIN